MMKPKHVILLLLQSLAIAICWFWYWSFLQESSAPAAVAIRMASGSETIVKALGGGPIKKRYVTGRIISGADYGNADLTIHIAGQTAKGTLFEWAQSGIAGWNLCSLWFEGENGRFSVLVKDEYTTCERE